MKRYLLAASFAALAASAHAQTMLDSVIVTARPDPEDPAVVADARVRLSRTPGAVSVISAESYADRQALALDDVLRDAPGVFAQKKFGGDARISIRGSGLGNANHNRGLLIAQDGLPLNEADGYGDSQSIDPLSARYVEVRRGGNALRFGGALLGGAINTVTPTGADAGFESRVRIDGGSFGLLREHAAIARQGGAWDIYAAASNQTGQGWRPQSQQNIQFATVNLGRAFGEDRQVRLMLTGAGIDQELAGALTWAQFQAGPRQAAPGAYANDYGRDQRVLRGSVQADWRLTEHATLKGGVYAIWKDLDHPIFQVIDQQSRNWGAFARLDVRGEVGGMRADGFAGLWLRTGDLDSVFYFNSTGARGGQASASLQNATAADLFAEGRLFVTERVALVAGASLGRAGRDYESAVLVASKDYEWAAPRIGVLWEAKDGAQVFANLTRSVEPPNFGAMSPSGTGFAPVRAQEAWTAEIGTRGRRGTLTWDLTAYRAELDGEILQYASGLNGVPATTFNAGDTIHQGIEAAADWRFAPGWRLRQTWTFSDFRFEGDAQYGDNRLPVVPENLYRAELRYERAGWFAAPQVEWSPTGAFVDFKNTARAPGYAVVNLNAGWRVTAAVSLFVDVRNLADRPYVSNVQPVIAAGPATAAYWPGDGRGVFAGLTASF